MSLAMILALQVSLSGLPDDLKEVSVRARGVISGVD